MLGKPFGIAANVLNLDSCLRVISKKMCGICGVLMFGDAAPSRDTIARMTRTLTHRGPDGEGIFVSDRVGLGHRRLAIIDLSDAGLQPMSTADNRYKIVYNGEVYNHKEIQRELELLGHRFESRTDTEVVLKSWVQWGIRSVERFNGMFAFAVWDNVTRELSMVRDRYGIKPLYYALVGDALVFGSEQRALLESRIIGRRLDRLALVEYLTFQNILSDRTFNSEIRILPPGHILHANCQTKRFHLTRYWDFAFEESASEYGAQEAEEELERRIRLAVKRQLQADVDIGTYLSGGLDSGTLATIATTDIPRLRTFTCGFDTVSSLDSEAKFDERIAARSLAKRLGTAHSEIIVGEADFGTNAGIVASQLEEPRVGQSYPNYLVARHASDFVKVVLSGTGGDELFAGYPWRYAAALKAADTRAFRRGYFEYWNRLLPSTNLSSLLAPIWNSVKDFDARQVFHSILDQHNSSESGNTRFLNDSLYFETKTFLHGLLVVEDKLSMAHGLETRLPFLDNDVVEFAMRCPTSEKLQSPAIAAGQKSQELVAAVSRQQSGLLGKVVLRKVCARIIGGSDAFRTKQGFAAPDSRWLAEPLRQILSDDRSFGVLGSVMSRQELIRFVKDPHTPTSHRRLIAWSIVNLRQVLNDYDL